MPKLDDRDGMDSEGIARDCGMLMPLERMAALSPRPEKDAESPPRYPDGDGLFARE